MARRAPPANRLLVEAALASIESGPTLLDALHDLAGTLGLEAEQWQEDASLQVVFETVAASAMVRELLAAEAGSMTWEQVVLEMAARLGISEKTLESRLRKYGSVSALIESVHSDRASVP